MRAQKKIRRSGFSFAEIVVALVVIAVLTAVILPGLTLRLRAGQAASLIQDIRAVNTAIHQYRENVGRYPGNLAQLTTTSTPQIDACGNALPANLTALWRGPYLGQDLSSGFSSGDATFKLPLVRNPTTPAPTYANLDGTLRFDIEKVDSLSAETVEAAFDGYSTSPVKFDGGVIQWVPIAGGGGLSKIGTLLYTLPVRGC